MGYMKKYEIKFYDKDVTPYIIYGGKVTIKGFINKKLLKEARQRKREFSNEFKDWFILIKANFDSGLTLHGNVDDWWWAPAMRLKNPGIQIKGIDY